MSELVLRYFAFAGGWIASLLVALAVARPNWVIVILLLVISVFALLIAGAAVAEYVQRLKRNIQSPTAVRRVP